MLMTVRTIVYKVKHSKLDTITTPSVHPPREKLCSQDMKEKAVLGIHFVYWSYIFNNNWEILKLSSWPTGNATLRIMYTVCMVMYYGKIHSDVTNNLALDSVSSVLESLEGPRQQSASICTITQLLMLLVNGMDLDTNIVNWQMCSVEHWPLWNTVIPSGQCRCSRSGQHHG